MAAIQMTFEKFEFLEKNLTHDVMFVKYYGQNSLKPFIDGKPLKMAYKLWFMCVKFLATVTTSMCIAENVHRVRMMMIRFSEPE